MNFRKINIDRILILLLIFCMLACNNQPEQKSKTSAAEVERSMVEVNRLLVAKDRERIKGYIERMGLKMTESSTGLWFEISVWGTGDSIREGDMVTLNFTVQLLDGNELYNSGTDGVKTFRVGRGGVESGLEEGILMLGNGGKASFIMPPHLAYGLPGDGDKIPARATLVYKVEVLAVE